MDAATVILEVLGAVDDAIAIAQDAVKSAEELRSRAPAENVVLVKVAKARYQSVAELLHKTGTFHGQTCESLAKSLESAGPAGLLEVMEKLASSAVFPFNAAEAMSGALVEKPSNGRTEGSQPGSKNDVWRQALDEAAAECAG